MAKEYKGFLDEAIKLGANLITGRVSIPNKETYKIGDNYISVGEELTFEWSYAEGADVHEINIAMDAYTRAAVEHSVCDQKETKGISAPVAQRVFPEDTDVFVVDTSKVTKTPPPAAPSIAATPPVAPVATKHIAFGPPVTETVSAPELDAPEPVEVVKFTLARRTDGKYDLGLFQLYGTHAGKYPELKYTAEQAPMWTMIGHLVENLSFDVMPVEYEVSWLAEWTHGREYTKKDETKGRYKDLVGLKAR